jgi:hypothetical protein
MCAAAALLRFQPACVSVGITIMDNSAYPLPPVPPLPTHRSPRGPTPITQQVQDSTAGRACPPPCSSLHSALLFEAKQYDISGTFWAAADALQLYPLVMLLLPPSAAVRRILRSRTWGRCSLQEGPAPLHLQYFVTASVVLTGNTWLPAAGGLDAPAPCISPGAQGGGAAAACCWGCSKCCQQGEALHSVEPPPSPESIAWESRR